MTEETRNDRLHRQVKALPILACQKAFLQRKLDHAIAIHSTKEAKAIVRAGIRAGVSQNNADEVGQQGANHECHN